MEQKQVQVGALSFLTRFYLFLRDRDAIIIELFFLGINSYFLGLILLPPYGYVGMALIMRALFQGIIVVLNVLALSLGIKVIRIISGIANAMIMTFISLALINTSSVHSGTYILLTVLAIFTCWKVTVR